MHAAKLQDGRCHHGGRVTYIQLTSNSPRLSAYLRNVARQLPQVLDEAVHQSALDGLGMWQSVEATWTTKSEFVIQHEGTGRWGIKTDDPRVKWLDKGTSVRYALMSKDWRSKTKPGYITSYQGAGHMVFVSRKHPRPGITARQFSRIIHERAQAPTANRLRAALKQATYGPGAGI